MSYEDEENVVASVRRSVPTAQAHQLFRGVFDDWLTKADALSALPNAPVVPDTPNAPNASRQLRLPTWRRLRSRFGRYAVTAPHLPGGDDRSGAPVQVGPP